MTTTNQKYERLLSILKKNKIPRHELATAMGYHESYFYGILSGRVKEPRDFKKKALEKVLFLIEMREEVENAKQRAKQRVKQRVFLEEKERKEKEEKEIEELYQQLNPSVDGP